MQFKVIIQPEAEGDLDCAVAWYEEQKAGLGIDFLSCFEVVLVSIKLNPFLYQKFFLRFHRALLRRFPYAVYYCIDEGLKTVSIYAVLHTHRDPESFKKRVL